MPEISCKCGHSRADHVALGYEAVNWCRACDCAQFEVRLEGGG